MIEDISKGVGSVKETIEFFLTRKSQRRKEVRDAVGRVLKAATTTRGYLADIKADESKQSREQELILRDMWLEACNSIYDIDPELGDKCMMKADGWSDTRLWDHPRYKHVPVDLDTIIYDCQRILRGINDPR